MSTSIFRTNASQVDEIQISETGNYSMLKTNTQYKSDVIKSSSQSGGTQNNDEYHFRHPNHRTLLVLKNDQSSNILLKGLTSATYTAAAQVSQSFSTATGTVVSTVTGTSVTVNVTSGTFDTNTSGNHQFYLGGVNSFSTVGEKLGIAHQFFNNTYYPRMYGGNSGTWRCALIGIQSK